MDWLQKVKYPLPGIVAFQKKVSIIYLSFFWASMSYVIATRKDNVNYCIRADAQSNRFVLVPIESDSDLSKILCHPYRVGATQIMQWIVANDPDLASEELEVCAEGKFRK